MTAQVEHEPNGVSNLSLELQEFVARIELDGLRYIVEIPILPGMTKEEFIGLHVDRGNRQSLERVWARAVDFNFQYMRDLHASSIDDQNEVWWDKYVGTYKVLCNTFSDPNTVDSLIPEAFTEIALATAAREHFPPLRAQYIQEHKILLAQKNDESLQVLFLYSPRSWTSEDRAPTGKEVPDQKVPDEQPDFELEGLLEAEQVRIALHPVTAQACPAGHFISIQERKRAIWNPMQDRMSKLKLALTQTARGVLFKLMDRSIFKGDTLIISYDVVFLSKEEVAAIRAKTLGIDNQPKDEISNPPIILGN